MSIKRDGDTVVPERRVALGNDRAAMTGYAPHRRLVNQVTDR